MSDYFASRDLRDLLPELLVRLPASCLAAAHLVSRDFHRVVHSPTFPRSQYDRQDVYAQALFLICNGRIFIIGTSRLVNEDRNVARPDLTERHFPPLNFPLTIIGSSEGLICVAANLEQIFVLNPCTRAVRGIVGDVRPAQSYAFGWRYYGDARCHIIVKVLDVAMGSFTMFNVNNNTWRNFSVDWEGSDWTCSINAGASSAFAHGRFFWLGSATLSGKSVPVPSVIMHDGVEDSISYLPLDENMLGIDLVIGNVGDDVVAIWLAKPGYYGNPNPLNRGPILFWIVDMTAVPHFKPYNVTGYAAGTQTVPLCFYDKWTMILACDDTFLDWYLFIPPIRAGLPFGLAEEPFLYFNNLDLIQVIAFKPSLMSPGDLDAPMN